MFNQVMSIINNGGLWTLIIIVGIISKQVNPVINAHLKAKKATARNAHELSLNRAAGRIIASLAKVAEASPHDRIAEAKNQLMIYANQRGIHVNDEQALNFVIKGFADYKANGGNIAKAVEDASKGVNL